LADRSRGAVWEEVIIHLPESVRVVALSATVSNAEEFGDWLAQVRGGTEVIVDEHRRSRCGSTCWPAGGCMTCSPTTTITSSTPSWSGSRSARSAPRRRPGLLPG